MIAAAFVFLWMDLPTGEIRGDWPAPDEPAAVGSLVKPFTALAYAQSHGFEYPEVTCHRCWSGRAHGKLGIVRAVAVSCNTYFHELAGAAAGVAQLVSRLGLAAPPDGNRDTLIGIGAAWRLSPKALLRAYVELMLRRNEPGVKELWEGMRESARSGTGKAIGGDALVKTGTAECVHGGAPGDGYAVVLAPAEKPHAAVLVRVHSQPGSEAARIAGELMKKGRGINPRPSVLSAR
jgi:cell division protein FtsI/penicillin-binding protein 2